MSKYNTHMHSLACANTRRYVRTHAHHTHTAHTHTHSILICVLKVDQLLCGYSCSCGAFCSFKILRLTTTPLTHDDTQRGAMPPRGQKLALTPMLIITAQVDAGGGGRGGGGGTHSRADVPNSWVPVWLPLTFSLQRSRGAPDSHGTLHIVKDRCPVTWGYDLGRMKPSGTFFSRLRAWQLKL